MSSSYRTNYQPIDGLSCHQDDDLSSPDIQPNLLIRVPDSGKRRWNHIEDLDSFFTRIYQFHQYGGFICMMAYHICGLIQIIFTVLITTFFATCVDYDILFHSKPKKTFYEAIYPLSEIPNHFNWIMILVLIVATLFWLLKFGQFISNYFQFREIESFYEDALGISTSTQEIGNFTWDEVLQKVIKVQVQERMCIHKENLSELDITHRILRFTNYLIALVNKDVLPLKITLPFVGDIIYLTRGLKYNLEFILFWGPWSPFENNWHIRSEYRKSDRRHELARQLTKKIRMIAIINLVFSPFILLWHVLSTFYSLTEKVRHSPGKLSSRRWSHYGKIYLRHFNELKHELRGRLNRAYKPASQYMDRFSSKLVGILANLVSHIFGSIAGVFMLLSLIDGDPFDDDGVWHILTVSGLIAMAAYLLIPNENIVLCHELLLTKVIGETHYGGDHWKGKAHTTHVRAEVSHLFQYKLSHIFEELVSPLFTPYILFFKVARNTLPIVDFYRNFTVEIPGVGDVCSFAQMDLNRHGSKTWSPNAAPYDSSYQDLSYNAMRTDGGKTELSLINFSLTKPNWRPPRESLAFLNALRSQAQKEHNALATLDEGNALSDTFDLFRDNLGLARNKQPFSTNRNSPSHLSQSIQRREQDSTLQQSNQGVLSCLSNSILSPPNDMVALDINASTYFLRELHQRRVALARYVDSQYEVPSHDTNESRHHFSNFLNHDVNESTPQFTPHISGDNSTFPPFSSQDNQTHHECHPSDDALLNRHQPDNTMHPLYSHDISDSQYNDVLLPAGASALIHFPTHTQFPMHPDDDTQCQKTPAEKSPLLKDT